GAGHPLDAWLDVAASSVSVGARELCCRLNHASRSFAKAADNLARAAQLDLSAELLRQVVEAEGKAVLAAGRTGALAAPWTATDCQVPDAQGAPTDVTR